MKRRLKLLSVGVSVHLACSAGFSRDQAASLIAAHESFTRVAHFAILTETPFVSIFTCTSQADLDQTPVNRFVVERGWVRYETRRALVGIERTASCPAFVLTSAGEAASAEWTQRPSTTGAGTEWTVPIGRRELVGVTGFTTAPDGSTEVAFDWKWTPNDIGTALQASAPETDAFFRRRTHRASCRRWDDGWRCEMGMWMKADEGLGLLSAAPGVRPTFGARPQGARR